MLTKAQQVADLLRTVSGSDKRIQPTSAVIAAGGSSTRMGDATAGVAKQHLELGGIPIIVRTLLEFEKCPMINEIIVVGREGEAEIYNEYRKKYSISKLTRVVGGGRTRQESVLRGFDAIDPKSKFVAIHDGARCLVTSEMIERVCLEAYRYKAATAATAVVDSVKLCDKHKFVDESVDRERVWLAQTPQIFYSTLYRAAAYSAREDGFEATDDNSLVERIKNPVRLVECGRENLKITTPEDLSLAEAILAAREIRKNG